MFWRPCSIFNKRPTRARRPAPRHRSTAAPRRRCCRPRYPRRFRDSPHAASHTAHARPARSRGSLAMSPRRALSRGAALVASRALASVGVGRAPPLPRHLPAPPVRPFFLPALPRPFFSSAPSRLSHKPDDAVVRRPPPRGAAHDPAQARGEVRPRRARARRHRVRLPERRARRPRGLRRVPRRGQRARDGRAAAATRRSPSRSTRCSRTAARSLAAPRAPSSSATSRSAPTSGARAGHRRPRRGF